MATIKEIAELAGVSRGTVDRVLNHRGFVNADTEKKVLEIANLLNYQPNKAGMALAAQKKKYVIGVLLFSEENPFFDAVTIGLNQKLEELSIYGCTILMRRIPFDLKAQLETMDALRAEGIHGLILSPYNAAEVQLKIDELWEAGIPCVTVNTDIPNSKRIAYVGSDYLKCGRVAANLLQLVGPELSGSALSPVRTIFSVMRSASMVFPITLRPTSFRYRLLTSVRTVMMTIRATMWFLPCCRSIRKSMHSISPPRACSADAAPSRTVNCKNSPWSLRLMRFLPQWKCLKQELSPQPSASTPRNREHVLLPCLWTIC